MDRPHRTIRGVTEQNNSLFLDAVNFSTASQRITPLNTVAVGVGGLAKRRSEEHDLDHQHQPVGERGRSD